MEPNRRDILDSLGHRDTWRVCGSPHPLLCWTEKPLCFWRAAQSGIVSLLITRPGERTLASGALAPLSVLSSSRDTSSLFLTPGHEVASF